ncbi:MAG: IS630 family transposase, partial [Gammaproteobacteria bacterium]|nr:IS630 family transposase [Gammaproteobacteria bacterium]
MDNAAFHKSLSTQELIKQAGHLLEYLPPYSPDLYPFNLKVLVLSSENYH